MLRVFLASHAHLASGLQSAVELLAGIGDRLFVCDAYVDGGTFDVSGALNDFLADAAPDDQILLLSDLYGGSVNTATGEFNFAVQEGYLIRDGKIASPVRGASLIGKGEQILMRIDRVGQHMTMGQGMCGSLSGSVPTNVGQPTIRVSSLTVGGK